jgi:hypothetical protein
LRATSAKRGLHSSTSIFTCVPPVEPAAVRCAMAGRRASGIPAPGFMVGPTCEIQVEHKAETSGAAHEQSVKEHRYEEHELDDKADDKAHDEVHDEALDEALDEAHDDRRSEASSNVSGSTSHASSFNLSGFKLLPLRCASCKAPFFNNDSGDRSLAYACPCCTQDFCSLCSSYRVRLLGSGFQGTRRVCKACAEAAVAPVGETGDLTGMAGTPVITNAQQVQLQAKALRIAQENHRSAFEDSTSAYDTTASADGAACIAAAAERAGLGSYHQDGAEVLLMRQRQQHMLARKEARRQSKRQALAAAAAARGNSSSSASGVRGRAGSTPGVTPASTANSSSASLFADNGLTNGLGNGFGNGLPLTPVPASPSSAPNSHRRGGTGQHKLQLHDDRSDRSGDEHIGSSGESHKCSKKLCNSCNNSTAAVVPRTATAQQVVLKGIQLVFFGCVAGAALYLLFGASSTGVAQDGSHVSRGLAGESHMPTIDSSSGSGVHRELQDLQSRAAAATTATITNVDDVPDEHQHDSDGGSGDDSNSSGSADSDTEHDTDESDGVDEHLHDEQTVGSTVRDDGLSKAAEAAAAEQQQQAQQSDNTEPDTGPDTEPDTELEIEPATEFKLISLPIDKQVQCVEPESCTETDGSEAQFEEAEQPADGTGVSDTTGSVAEPDTTDAINAPADNKSSTDFVGGNSDGVDSTSSVDSSDSVDSSSNCDEGHKVPDEQSIDDDNDRGVTDAGDDGGDVVDADNNNDELITIPTDDNEPSITVDDDTTVLEVVDEAKQQTADTDGVDDVTIDDGETVVDDTTDTADEPADEHTHDTTVVTTETTDQTDEQQQQQQQQIDGTSTDEKQIDDANIITLIDTDVTDNLDKATDETDVSQQQQQSEPLYMQLPTELKVGQSILVSQALWNERSRDVTVAATGDTTATTSQHKQQQQQAKCAPHYLVLHTSGDLALYRGLLNAVSGSISTDIDTTAQHKRVWHVQSSKNREGAGFKLWSFVTRRSQLQDCEHCVLQLQPTGVLQLSEGDRELWASHKPKSKQKKRSESSGVDSSSSGTDSSDSGVSGDNFAAAITADGALAVKDVNTDKTVWSVNKRRFFGLL